MHHPHRTLVQEAERGARHHLGPVQARTVVADFEVESRRNGVQSPDYRVQSKQLEIVAVVGETLVHVAWAIRYPRVELVRRLTNQDGGAFERFGWCLRGHEPIDV